MKSRILLFISLILFNKSFSQNSFFGNRIDTEKRIEKIKQSTVKILVDNIKLGTGFFFLFYGLLITNWHVVINDKLRLDEKNNILNNPLGVIKLFDF